MAKEYRAIEYFTDAQDNDYPYIKGDKYPREGLVVSEFRIKELSTPFNSRNCAVIEEVETPKTRRERIEDEDDR